MKSYLSVPNYNIDSFITYKKRGESFRPAATGLSHEKTLLNLENEILEEKDMLGFTETSGREERDLSRITPSEFTPYEDINDTQWYKLGDNQIEYSVFYKFNSLERVLIPKDISLFNRYVDIRDVKKLHWSNSEGFVHDGSLNLAVQKGVSELIENHQKMFWWFGKNRIITKKVPDKLSSILKSENHIHSIHVYMINDRIILNRNTYMACLETEDWPYISIGFGTDTDENRGTIHSILEAINSYRGLNWYRTIKGEILYSQSFITDLKDRISDTLTAKRIGKPKNRTVDLYYKILNKKTGYTVKVFSPNLQPLISNRYVPFYFKELCTKENQMLRNKYNGTPFV